MYIRASTAFETHTYLRVEVTLIDPCRYEEVEQPNGNSFKKDFTMRETHPIADLKLDVSQYLISSMPIKNC